MSSYRSMTFILCTNKFISGGKKLYLYANEYLTPGADTGGIPVVLGFTSTGATRGTPAAIWQSAIGNSVSGSPFATAQSMAMKGSSFTIQGTPIREGILGVVTLDEWAKCIDWRATEMVSGIVDFESEGVDSHNAVEILGGGVQGFDVSEDEGSDGAAGS